MGSCAFAVVGANYGDEGKGLLVDFLASKIPDAKVVRFSGGAQAGHTVVTPEGKRHVFGHFGAGTLVGNVTYLSRYFIVNPMLFEREYKELLNKGIVPRIEIDQACMVTTPWDMIINRIVARGKSMSCGVGINETVTRFEKSPFKFTVGNETKVDLEGMYKDYFYQRLKELGVKDIPVHFKEILESHHNLKSNFNDSMEYMLDKCIVVNGMPKDQDIIFEGSQGLLLDPDYGIFPYVTRASVGIKNAVVLAKEAKIDNFHSIYVTRCYLTRHGAGPLPNEMDPPEIDEKTNVNNPWQGKLRFAPLDLQELRGRISFDSTQSMCIFPYDFSSIKRTVAVTCMDHYSKISNSSSKEFAASLQTDLSHSLILAEGPTRNDVTTKWINHTTNLGDSA